jgi:hypothetical protein
VEAALNVSEYTDKVDVAVYRDKSKRMAEQLKSVFSIICGLMVAEDYKAGEALMQQKEHDGAEEFFKTAFEIARRYKVLNPDRMRADYGKLLHMLQDSVDASVKELTGIECVRPMKTVHSFLASRGEKALAMLRDPIVRLATATVVGGGRARHLIDTDIKRKEAAIETLARRYAFGKADRPKRGGRYFYSWYLWADEDSGEEAAGSGGGGEAGKAAARFTADEVKHCLYSIGDNEQFLLENVVPVQKMLVLLATHFREARDPATNLAIQSGVKGARLTHNHAVQYTYCRQSLLLWNAILSDFYKYWMFAEQDFLDPRHPYSLRDTGQGLNRVQRCPRAARAMADVLHRVQSAEGSWVGSSVVHLGDTNVPNSFVFLDKYVQVSRILAPMVLVVETIPKLLREHPALSLYVEKQFGGEDGLVKAILGDFFRHGFVRRPRCCAARLFNQLSPLPLPPPAARHLTPPRPPPRRFPTPFPRPAPHLFSRHQDGSGADNFFDAGSCIDGRLTSAWEWCSKIDRKPFAPVFRLCSVLGFDGRWDGK